MQEIKAMENQALFIKQGLKHTGILKKTVKMFLF